MEKFIKGLSASKRLRSFCLALTFCFVAGLSAQSSGVLPEDRGTNPIKKISTILEDGAFNAQILFKAMADGLKAVKSLDYYTADKVAFECMGYELVLDFGSTGSGNLFEPLKAVTPRFNIIGKGDSQLGNISIASVAKVVIKNEFLKRGRKSKSNILKILTSFEISPIFLLGFKLVLLVKSLESEQNASSFFEEVVSLLFRLSLVDDVKLFDKTKNLTDYLPEAITDTLEDLNIGASDFINSVWGLLVCDKTMPADLIPSKPVAVNGFVFSQEAMAKEAYGKLVKQTENDFCDEIEKFGDNKNFEVIGFVDFREKTSKELSASNVSGNPFASNFIGSKEFNFDKNSLPNSKFEEALLGQIKDLNGKEGVVYIQDPEKHEYWVAQITPEIGWIGAAKSLLLTFTRAFKDYVSFKKSLFDGDDDFALKYRREFTASESQRKLLEKFVRSEYGKQIYADICREVDLAVGTENAKKLIQDALESKKAELEKELAVLNSSKEIKSSELTKLRQLLVGYGKQNKSKIDKEIEAINVAIFEIGKQIADKRHQLSDNQTKLNGFALDQNDPLFKDKQRLEKLNALAEKKRQAGEPVDQLILDWINKLEDKIKKSSINTVTVAQVEEKLAVRENVLNVLKKYATALRDDLKLKDAELDKLDEDERIFQELLLDEAIAMKKAFADRLDSEVQRIQEGNQKVKRLDSLRRAYASKDVSSKELESLEIEFGHVIDSNSHENFIAKLMMHNSIFEEFVHDLSQENSDKIKVIKQRVIESVNATLNGSNNFKDNAIVYRYVSQFLPTSLKGMMRAVGLSEFCNA